MASAVVAVATVVGGLLTLSKASDIALGTNIVTPKKKEARREAEKFREQRAREAALLEQRKADAGVYDVTTGRGAFSGSTTAENFAKGFANYINDLVSIAPHYIMRERPSLRAQYKRAVELRERRLDEEVQKFKALPTIHTPNIPVRESTRRD